MNRRKLVRRTALAGRIAAKWDIHRRVIDAYRETYEKPRAWSLLTADGLKPSDFEPDVGEDDRLSGRIHPAWNLDVNLDRIRERIKRGDVRIADGGTLIRDSIRFDPDDRTDSMALALSTLKED